MYTAEKDGRTMRLKNGVQAAAFKNNGWTVKNDADDEKTDEKTDGKKDDKKGAGGAGQ